MNFSIIIPIYNKENYVRTSIESVLNQTYDNFELLLVNDGSSDNSLHVLESFQDKRIQIINKNNEGVSSARNTGIKAAKYKYIALLDGDDIWECTYLETMKRLIEDFPEASFYGCQFGYKTSSKLKNANIIHRNRGYIKNYFKEAIKAPLICSSSVIIKVSCFDEIEMFDPTLSRGEDIDLWSRLGRRYKFAFEPTMLSIYMQDIENRECRKNYSINKSFISRIDFINTIGYERKFYKHLIKKKILNSLFRTDYYTILYLIKKYNTNIIF